MSANVALILAGVAAGGTAGTDLMWVAPIGSTAPTNTGTALAAAWKSVGAIDPSGLAKKVAETRKDILMYGALVPARTLLTGAVETYDITMMETSALVTEIYNKAVMGSTTVAADGSFSLTTGQQSTVKFAVVFWVVDGSNAIRFYCPNVEVTARKDRAIAEGSAITYGVTMTAYPGATDNIACHEFYLMNALAT